MSYLIIYATDQIEDNSYTFSVKDAYEVKDALAELYDKLRVAGKHLDTEFFRRTINHLVLEDAIVIMEQFLGYVKIRCVTYIGDLYYGQIPEDTRYVGST